MGKTWTEKGRGRKQCPECGIYHGVRAAVCPACGFVHPKKKATLRPQKTPEERAELARRKAEKKRERQAKRAESDSREIILIPSGKCPVPLESSDSDAVKSWARQVISAVDHQYERRYRLSDEALLYWMRTQLSGDALEQAVAAFRS